MKCQNLEWVRCFEIHPGPRILSSCIVIQLHPKSHAVLKKGLRFKHNIADLPICWKNNVNMVYSLASLYRNGPMKNPFTTEVSIKLGLLIHYCKYCTKVNGLSNQNSIVFEKVIDITSNASDFLVEVAVVNGEKHGSWTKHSYKAVFSSLKTHWFPISKFPWDEENIAVVACQGLKWKMGEMLPYLKHKKIFYHYSLSK